LPQESSQCSRFEQQAKGAGRPGSKDGLVKIKHQKNTPEITAARKLISIFNENHALKWIQKASSCQKITKSIAPFQDYKSNP